MYSKLYLGTFPNKFSHLNHCYRSKTEWAFELLLGWKLEIPYCLLKSLSTRSIQVKSVSGKKDLAISYPCVMLNVMVAKNNTNDQYQDLIDPITKTYKTSSQMSIEFEVDGPYKVSFHLLSSMLYPWNCLSQNCLLQYCRMCKGQP